MYFCMVNRNYEENEGKHVSPATVGNHPSW